MTERDQAFWKRVRKTDSCWDWLGGKTATGHARFKFKGTVQYAYRYSYEMTNGQIPKGAFIDHLCHNPSCVKPSHLRAATHQQNMANRKGAHKNSRSGIRGVNWHKHRKMWRGEVTVNGRSIHVGYFESIEEAAEATERVRQEVYSIPGIK